MPKIHHLLGILEPLVLDQAGSITVVNDVPRVQCIFAPTDRERFDSLTGFQPLTIPFGHLVDLRPGDIVHPDGRVSQSKDQRTFSMEVEVVRQKGHLPTRQHFEDLGCLPKAIEQLPDSSSTKDSLWQLLKPTDRSVDAVMVPAWVVFLTYYAPTSPLAYEYLSAGILDWWPELHGAGTTDHGVDGTKRFVLPKKRYPSEIIPIGRALFAPNAYTAVEAIVNSVMLDKRTGSICNLVCPFPFEGKTTLTYRAWVDTHYSGRVTHVVTDILECTYPLPWKRLEVTLEFRAKSKKGPEDGSKGRGFADFDENEFVPIDSDAPVPQPDIPLVVHTEHETRFPNPGPTAISVKRPDPSAEGGRGSGPPRQPGEPSLSPASGEGDKGGRETHVVPGKSQEDDDRIGPEDAFLSVVNDLALLQETEDCEIEPVKVSSTCVSYYGWVLNQIPNPGQAGTAWSFICGGRRLRCVLIYAIKRGRRHAYVLEILRNHLENYSTLLLQNPGGGQIPLENLSTLYARVLATNGLPSDAVIEAAADATVLRVRHPSSTENVTHLLARTALPLLGGPKPE